MRNRRSELAARDWQTHAVDIRGTCPHVLQYPISHSHTTQRMRAPLQLTGSKGTYLTAYRGCRVHTGTEHATLPGGVVKSTWWAKRPPPPQPYPKGSRQAPPLTLTPRIMIIMTAQPHTLCRDLTQCAQYTGELFPRNPDILQIRPPPQGFDVNVKKN